LRITLWGQRAKDLCVRSVYDEENAKAIVVLFVGCLAKNFRGIKMQTNTVHTYTYICYIQKTYIFATLQEVYILVEVQHVTGISILPFQRLNHITLGTKEQKKMFLSYFFFNYFPYT
jgi:hypothetical protein